MFGSHKNIILEDLYTFKQIADEYDGKYLKPKNETVKKHRLQLRSMEWNIFIEILEEPFPDHYTKVSSTYFGAGDENFLFTIYREGLICKIGKILGMQDIVVGYKKFDKDFIIKSTNAKKVKRILKNKEIRDLLSDQEDFHFKNIQPGSFGRNIPKDLYVLNYQEGGVITDYKTLKDIIELFTLYLNCMVEFGIASDRKPDLRVTKQAIV